MFDLSMSISELKLKIQNLDSNAWLDLKNLIGHSETPSDLILLNKFRKMAVQKGISYDKFKSLKIAIIGGYTFHPFADFLATQLLSHSIRAEILVGEYDNYVSEILSEESAILEFAPDFVLFFPPEKKYKAQGGILEKSENQLVHIKNSARELIDLCKILQEKTKAEILLANLKLIPENHFGQIKHSNYKSDWNYRKRFNQELGEVSSSSIHIIDLEYLSCVLGVERVYDARGWYETKQMGSPEFLTLVSKHAAQTLANARKASKKVIVLDLDNTLWGGVIGDDGLEGIELGDTSARAEAFKDFQKFILSLKERGFLLAVSSKNNEETAQKPFLEHPDMVLKLDDIVSFKANWGSKADSINEISQILNLGLESFVFIDDNPAEISIVNQFLPEVSTIQLSSDPADFISLATRECHFYQNAITAEDLEKTNQYRVEEQRHVLKHSITDMGSYLQALEMKAIISNFQKVDVSRISQLINKSNQFNLTTKRRSESEVLDVLENEEFRCFTVRLSDRFGDYGLISVVILKKVDTSFEIDSLLMSCRVLERGVEQEIFNKIVRIANAENIKKVIGVYIPTKKNAMVKGLYAKYGFDLYKEEIDKICYLLDQEKFKEIPTYISVEES